MKTQNRRRGSHHPPHTKHNRATELEWNQGALRIQWIPEPNLQFAHGGISTDPKEGLSIYGPYGIDCNEHREQIRVGFVGTQTTIEQAKRWLKRCAEPISGIAAKRRQFPDFPGFNRESPFESEFIWKDIWDNQITQRELASVLNSNNKVQGFEQAVNLFANKVKLIGELDAADVIVCALPPAIEEFYSSIGPNEIRNETTPFARAIRKIIRQAEDAGQNTFLQQLFPEESSAIPGLLNRNFRRALKASTNKASCPVQIMRQRSLVENDPSAQDIATRAWNMAVGMYFKAKGKPWQVEGLDPDTCYLGISFYHHITAESHTVHSSLAQLFTTSGDSLVLRGEKFEWEPDGRSRSPHLTSEYAQNLIKYILDKYYSYRQIQPKRVVLHKTSRFYEDERSGIINALDEANISQYDLISLGQTGVRFFREGAYPPIRGTWCQLGRSANWIYTRGYLPSQGTYPSSYVPKPFEITDKYGDSADHRILQEIMALTKMNSNSADYSCAMPITLMFARKVGEILAYLQDDSFTEPNPNFRFYC